MAKRNVHVVKPRGRLGRAKREGGKRASVVSPTQGEAIDAARKIAQREGTELVVHGRDGKIREKDSHGRDPYPPKG